MTTHLEINKIISQYEAMNEHDNSDSDSESQSENDSKSTLNQSSQTMNEESPDLQNEIDISNTKVSALCSFYCDEIEDTIFYDKTSDFNQITEQLHQLEQERMDEMHDCLSDVT